LTRAGIDYDDAKALRRIAMTLHRWAVLECGDASGNCIERDETTGKPFMTYESFSGVRRRSRHVVADRETGALKRLAKLMAKYPALKAYHQGDPRGAALYILRPGDVLPGMEVDSCYSRGLAVYQ
jgi:hypothetical protein